MTETAASALAGPVAVAGLGAMGGAMAGVLVRAGAAVRLWNRTASVAADRAQALGDAARACATPAEAAAGAAYAIANVSSDDGLRSVCLGADGLIAGLGAGGVLVDMGTSGPAATAEIAAAAAAAGVVFADAPVSGGQGGAEAGALSIMYGCAEAEGARLAPLFAILGDRASRIGDVGAGRWPRPRTSSSSGRRSKPSPPRSPWRRRAASTPRSCATRCAAASPIPAFLSCMARG